MSHSEFIHWAAYYENKTQDEKRELPESVLNEIELFLFGALGEDLDEAKKD